MVDVSGKLKVVQEAGQLGIDLLACETPPVGYQVAEADDGKPVLQDDDQFSVAWERIRDLIDGFGPDDVEVEEWRDDEVPFLSAHSERYVDGQEFAHADVNYAADGTLLINLEFKIEDGWGTYISQQADDLTELEIGRKTGTIELAVLAHELESPAETLDYWMTSELYTFRQATWADVRQASQQTVSDRVRAAREKLGEE